MIRTSLQRRRVLFQAGFFTLFVMAPVFDLFRFDLNQNQFYLLGLHWTLGLAPFQRGEIDGGQAVLNLLLYGFLPLVLLAGLLIGVAWRYGRLYCGWLCPHYSVLELINRLMLRACGKPSLWERKPLPPLQADGTIISPDRWWWIPTILAILFFSLLWAVALLTYLLPPFEIYHNLFSASLTRNQFLFIAVATLLLAIEFTLARHFFCRFGCAVGFFQSLAWMSNRRAMVVDFARDQSATCKQCNNACDNACPMRLQPRNRKRRMFACTQCAECISACQLHLAPQDKPSLLSWVEGIKAEHQSEPPVGIKRSR